MRSVSEDRHLDSLQQQIALAYFVGALRLDNSPPVGQERFRELWVHLMLPSEKLSQGVKSSSRFIKIAHQQWNVPNVLPGFEMP